MTKQLESGQSAELALAQRMMKNWKQDPGLASIRDAEVLAKLSDDERAAFQQPWSAVDELLTKVAKAH